VRAALAKQLTAVTLEMTDELHALQAVSLKRSRMTETCASSCSLSARFASRTSITASWRFARASSSVAPCAFGAGQLFDEADEALGDLLKDGGQFDRHDEILTRSPFPAVDEIEFSGARKPVGGPRETRRHSRRVSGRRRSP
jgi:hypothetical protein